MLIVERQTDGVLTIFRIVGPQRHLIVIVLASELPPSALSRRIGSGHITLGHPFVLIGLVRTLGIICGLSLLGV